MAEKQWTVKGVEDEVRNAFILAARSANLSMGSWMNKFGPEMVRAYLDNRAPTFPAAGGNAVVPTEHSGGNPHAELERLATLAATITPSGKDSLALKIARRAVADRLRMLSQPS